MNASRTQLTNYEILAPHTEFLTGPTNDSIGALGSLPVGTDPSLATPTPDPAPAPTPVPSPAPATTPDTLAPAPIGSSPTSGTATTPESGSGPVDTSSGTDSTSGAGSNGTSGTGNGTSGTSSGSTGSGSGSDDSGSSGGLVIETNGTSTSGGGGGSGSSGQKTEEDPIILNLRGAAVQTVGMSNSSAYFDMQNNGQKVQTGWATAGEGILVYDPNNTNTVTQDANLVAGFGALSVLANQTGGVLDASNPLWNDLKVWVDPTGTGSFQQGQLETLGQLGITSINLNSTAENVNSNGNTILNDSTFTWSNGTTGDIAGVGLAFNPSVVASSTVAGSTPSTTMSGSLNHLIQSMAAFTDGNTGIDPTFSSASANADAFQLAASHAVQHA